MVLSTPECNSFHQNIFVTVKTYLGQGYNVQETEYDKKWESRNSGPSFKMKNAFPDIVISIIKIRWLRDCLIFIMGIGILV